MQFAQFDVLAPLENVVNDGHVGVCNGTVPFSYGFTASLLGLSLYACMWCGVGCAGASFIQCGGYDVVIIW